MAPRVLVVHRELDLEGVEQEVAPDGDAAVALLERERFDAVFLDLGLPPLDGWCVLATVGAWPDSGRPRIVVTVATRADLGRARALGADLCLTTGTTVNPRALERSTKEMQCRRFPASSFRRPTTSGVSV